MRPLVTVSTSSGLISNSFSATRGRGPLSPPAGFPRPEWTRVWRDRIGGAIPLASPESVEAVAMGPPRTRPSPCGSPAGERRGGGGSGERREVGGAGWAEDAALRRRPSPAGRAGPAERPEEAAPSPGRRIVASQGSSAEDRIDTGEGVPSLQRQGGRGAMATAIADGARSSNRWLPAARTEAGRLLWEVPRPGLQDRPIPPPPSPGPLPVRAPLHAAAPSAGRAGMMSHSASLPLLSPTQGTPGSSSQGALPPLPPLPYAATRAPHRRGRVHRFV